MKKIFLFVLLLCVPVLNAQWSEQTSPVTTALRSVSSVNSTTAWICGASGVILRTTNTGTYWQNVSSSTIPTSITLISVAGIDANTALVAGYSGSPSITWLWKTSDGGANWELIFYQSYGGFIDAICMYSATNGILIGDPVPAGSRWSLWKTTNAGTSWDSAGMYLLAGSSAEAGWNNSAFSLQPYMWFGTNNSKIYFSTNNGSTWTSQTTPRANVYALSFYPFNGNYNGFAGADSLLATTNSGNTWSIKTSPGVNNFSGVSTLIVPMIQGVWYVKNGLSQIFFSLNNGATFNIEYTASAGTYYSISAGKPGVGFWAVRSNGGISYRQPVTYINTISSETPDNYKLFQNYPNPFNPTTNIRYQVSKNSFVSLKVYDLSGKEIANLINKNQNPGTYETSFSAYWLSSGVYFYTLSAGNFRETKKMMIVK
jgi:photosystem II stability/assembly factor-like uncharacterized protein